MRIFAPSLVAACLSLPALAGTVEPPPKTNSSLPIDESLLTERPYNLNGVVYSDDSRGSGVVAQDRHLFLTAGHVLYDDAGSRWSLPPLWFSGVNSEDAPAEESGVQARGFFRWASYAKQVELSGSNSRAAFTRDAALAWSFDLFTEEAPAVVDFKGAVNLRAGIPSMITGYPALIDYTGNEGNYYLHTTLEEAHPFKSEQGNYLYATHISTGPGNSGGPVWVRDGEGGWKVGALLVSGRPSEAGLYAFTSEIKSLFKSAQPVLGESVTGTVKDTSSVTTSSRLAALSTPKVIPDGRQKWTRIPLKIGAFPEGSVISFVRLNLTITTNHVGDLVVGLLGPDGTFVLLHDSEGAGADDLVINDMDLSGEFIGGGESTTEGIPGKWQLLVQDRLTEDIATVTRFQLEVGTD
ncbi:proprotein convertase P-domain-containing protein [Luteolibacter soli]|uniref:Proprotein convertase P-domain-containing protein n=1 Tax=Luteolibacter soli TaxID=3135280 RepID=A0ABU9B1R1_9BACT